MFPSPDPTILNQTLMFKEHLKKSGASESMANVISNHALVIKNNVGRIDNIEKFLDVMSTYVNSLQDRIQELEEKNE